MSSGHATLRSANFSDAHFGNDAARPNAHARIARRNILVSLRIALIASPIDQFKARGHGAAISRARWAGRSTERAYGLVEFPSRTIFAMRMNMETIGTTVGRSRTVFASTRRHLNFKRRDGRSVACLRPAKEGTRHGGGYPISGLERSRKSCVTSACPYLQDSSGNRRLPRRRVRCREMRSDTRASGSCSVPAW